MTAREIPEPSYSDPKTNQQKYGTSNFTNFQNRMRLRIIFHLVLEKNGNIASDQPPPVPLL